MIPSAPRRASLRRPRIVASLLALAGVAACDIPSSAPIFQQTWIVPTDSTTIGVSTFLPAGVSVSGGGAPSFLLTTPSTAVNTTLGALCGQPACQSSTTVSAPTPAFTSPPGLLGSTVALPSGVNSATVTGGTLNVVIVNNLGFDPLRPNGTGTAPYGRIIFTISSGTVARTDTIVGSPTVGVPNGTTTTLVATLPTGVYASSVSVNVTLVVPAGGTASLNRNNAFALTSTLQNFAVSQATVVVNNVAVNTSPTSFSLSDVDLSKEVQSGGVFLDIDNPFTAAAALDLVLAAPAQGGAPAVSISKPITIPAQPTSSTSVMLSQSELQSLLGKTGVSVRVTGTANGTGAGNTTSLTPTSHITIRTRLQLVLNVGA
ncbi:MAG: hypothetical protein OEW77_00610 [Gemmatimonadota bacterium]|nr:hypothetical protein [Gemmatimonadota bacterium]